MRLITGNLWDAPATIGATVIAVTTNAYVRKDGRLAMGRGAALQAAERFPELPALAGRAIGLEAQSRARRPLPRCYGLLPDYGWCIARHAPAPALALFQTKRRWDRPADLALIRWSCAELAGWVARLGRHEMIALNFPGVGHGGLARADVLPIIATLPDSVAIYEQE